MVEGSRLGCCQSCNFSLLPRKPEHGTKERGTPACGLGSPLPVSSAWRRAEPCLPGCQRQRCPRGGVLCATLARRLPAAERHRVAPCPSRTVKMHTEAYMCFMVCLLVTRHLPDGRSTRARIPGVPLRVANVTGTNNNMMHARAAGRHCAPCTCLEGSAADGMLAAPHAARWQHSQLVRPLLAQHTPQRRPRGPGTGSAASRGPACFAAPRRRGSSPAPACAPPRRPGPRCR